MPLAGKHLLHAALPGEMARADREEHRARLVQPRLIHSAQVRLRLCSSSSISSGASSSSFISRASASASPCFHASTIWPSSSECRGQVGDDLVEIAQLHGRRQRIEQAKLEFGRFQRRMRALAGLGAGIERVLDAVLAGIALAQHRQGGRARCAAYHGLNRSNIGGRQAVRQQCASKAVRCCRGQHGAQRLAGGSMRLGEHRACIPAGSVSTISVTSSCEPSKRLRHRAVQPVDARRQGMDRAEQVDRRIGIAHLPHRRARGAGRRRR